MQHNLSNIHVFGCPDEMSASVFGSCCGPKQTAAVNPHTPFTCSSYETLSVIIQMITKVAMDSNWQTCLALSGIYYC